MGSSAIFVSWWMKRISHGAFAWLSRPVSRLKRIRELCFSARQGELKYGAAESVRICPQPAPMGVDDRPADRQPHPHAAGFRGVECLENALQMRRIDARPGIAHCYEGAGVVLLGADEQFSWPGLDRAHGFNGVQDQVQDDLLQLNAIPLNGKQSVRKPGLDGDAVPGDYASRQYDYLIHRGIKIKPFLPRRRFLHLFTDAVDDG